MVFGNVENNTTIVEPSKGSSSSKKIMVTNLNPEKIRKIEVAVAKLMKSSYSSDPKSNKDGLDRLLI